MLSVEKRDYWHYIWLKRASQEQKYRNQPKNWFRIGCYIVSSVGKVLIKERADYEKSAQEQEEARIAAEAAMEPIRIDSKDGIAPVKSGSAKTSAVMNQIGATCHGYYCVRVYQDYKYKGVKVRIELSGYIDEMHADITPSKTDVFLPNSAQRVILSDPIENGPFAEAYRALLPVYEGLVNKVDDR